MPGANADAAAPLMAHWAEGGLGASAQSSDAPSVDKLVAKARELAGRTAGHTTPFMTNAKQEVLLLKADIYAQIKNAAQPDFDKPPFCAAFLKNMSAALRDHEVCAKAMFDNVEHGTYLQRLRDGSES